MMIGTYDLKGARSGDSGPDGSAILNLAVSVTAQFSARRAGGDWTSSDAVEHGWLPQQIKLRFSIRFEHADVMRQIDRLSKQTDETGARVTFPITDPTCAVTGIKAAKFRASSIACDEEYEVWRCELTLVEVDSDSHKNKHRRDRLLRDQIVAMEPEQGFPPGDSLAALETWADIYTGV